jgi:hypothetical protein
MAEKTHPSSFEAQDLRTDYALIATGVAAAVLALAYLLLT